jgi:sugar phosphate permease
MLSGRHGNGTGSSGMRWLVAAVLFVAVISAFFDRISIAVLFTNTAFQHDIGTGFNPALLGMLMTAFLLAYGASGICLSFIGDLIGPKKSLIIGTLVWGGAMAAIGITSSYGLMLVYRVVLGIAEGPQFGISSAVVKRWFPSREQGRANALWMMASPIGSAVGFPLAIAIVVAYGWRASFYALAALNVFVVLPLVLAIIRDRPSGTKTVVVKAASRSYAADVRVFARDYRFWLITVFNSAALVYLWGLNSWLPAYLTRVRHFDLHATGLFASLPFVLMLAGELGGAAFSDRTGRRASTCFVGLFGAGVLMYAGARLAEPHLAAIAIALSACCWGISLPTLFALSLEIIPAGVTSTAVGVYNGIGNLVGAFAPVLIGWLIARTGAFDAGLMVLVLAAVVGSFAMLPLLRYQRHAVRQAPASS